MRHGLVANYLNPCNSCPVIVHRHLLMSASALNQDAKLCGFLLCLTIASSLSMLTWQEIGQRAWLMSWVHSECQMTAVRFFMYLMTLVMNPAVACTWACLLLQVVNVCTWTVVEYVKPCLDGLPQAWQTRQTVHMPCMWEPLQYLPCMWQPLCYDYGIWCVPMALC